MDEQSKIPLAYVHIFDQTSGNGAISDIDGNFEISITVLPSQIEFSYVGYHKEIIEVGTVYDGILRVELSKSSETLPEVVVSSKVKIQELTESVYSVKDFIPFEDKILLVKSLNSFNPNILTLMDTEGKVIDRLALKGIKKIESLHRSCLGGLYLVAAANVYEINFDANGKMALTQGIPRTRFDKLVQPCVLSSESNIYYRHSHYKGQFVEFKAFQKDGEKNFVLTKIMDEKNIELLFTDVLPKAKRISTAAAIENPESLRNLRKIEQDIDNTLHLFYQPLYTPIVNNGKELCIFNHFEGFAEFYTYDGAFIRKIPLTYLKSKEWAKKVLTDKVTGKSYIVFNNRAGKTIREFNYANGSLGEAIRINSTFVGKMMVQDGNLFYLESDLGGQGIKSVNRILKKVSL